MVAVCVCWTGRWVLVSSLEDEGGSDGRGGKREEGRQGGIYGESLPLYLDPHSANHWMGCEETYLGRFGDGSRSQHCSFA